MLIAPFGQERGVDRDMAPLLKGKISENDRLGRDVRPRAETCTEAVESKKLDVCGLWLFIHKINTGIPDRIVAPEMRIGGTTDPAVRIPDILRQIMQIAVLGVQTELIARIMVVLPLAGQAGRHAIAIFVDDKMTGLPHQRIDTLAIGQHCAQIGVGVTEIELIGVTIEPLGT